MSTNNKKNPMLLSMTNGTMLRYYSQEDAIDVMREAGFDDIDFSFLL